MATSLKLKPDEIAAIVLLEYMGIISKQEARNTIGFNDKVVVAGHPGFAGMQFTEENAELIIQEVRSRTIKTERVSSKTGRKIE